MKDLLSKNNKQKSLFRSYYCLGCKQVKSCQLLTGWDSVWKSYCCSCFYQTEQAKAEEYSDYQQVYQRKVSEREAKNKQYQLLKSYQGCKQCGSKELDAYHLYQENKLICQPCRMKKEGGASGSVSFTEQQKWFKKFWKVEIVEWLDNYGCLPVNYHCADKWLKDKGHLDNCQCLEIEAQKHYLLANDNLKRSWERLKECQCLESKKVRVSSDDYAWCERCEGSISAASKKRVIKNRNDPRFWGLEIKEKVLCGACLEKIKEGMTPLRRAKFNEYRKLGRL